MMKRKTTKPRKKLAAVKECAFCKEHKEPSLDAIDNLKSFLTERGKILARSRSGLCAKHQRVFTSTVKHARFLALLAYTNKD